PELVAFLDLSPLVSGKLKGVSKVQRSFYVLDEEGSFAKGATPGLRLAMSSSPGIEIRRASSAPTPKAMVDTAYVDGIAERSPPYLSLPRIALPSELLTAAPRCPKGKAREQCLKNFGQKLARRHAGDLWTARLWHPRLPPRQTLEDELLETFAQHML